jgi:hypothetical protein
MHLIEIKKTSNVLKQRVVCCKKILPSNWRQRIIKLAPEYDSLRGARLMDNVFKLRSSDLTLTELMESIAESHQKAKQIKAKSLS